MNSSNGVKKKLNLSLVAQSCNEMNLKSEMKLNGCDLKFDVLNNLSQ